MHFSPGAHAFGPGVQGWPCDVQRLLLQVPTLQVPQSMVWPQPSSCVPQVPGADGQVVFVGTQHSPLLAQRFDAHWESALQATQT